MTLALTLRFALAVMGAVEANTVAAFTVSVLLPLVPRTVLPNALKALPAVTVTAALAVIGAELAKVVTAFTVRVWLPLAPRTTLPLAVTRALAVMGAVVAKVVTALTVRVWLLVVPRTVLPAAVRVLEVLLRVTPVANKQKHKQVNKQMVGWMNGGKDERFAGTNAMDKL